jgi:ribonuclease D
MIITDQQELELLCQKLSACPFITIDTEFLRERTYYPKLCLIQVSGPDQQAAAIDPIEGKMDLSPLFEILLNPKILKILHAGRQDLEIFYRLTGKVIGPFFDTQIAAMVCGYGDSVGYENLVRDITGASLDKSVQFTDWSKRPLSQRQVDYALGDVIHLVKIYEHMVEDLEKKGRTSWVFQEEEILADPATYANNPQESWRRIKLRSPKPKTLAVLRELAAWRETQAQKRDMPRTWLVRDETLADMAAQSPRTVEQLKKIRGFNSDQADGHIGKTILELIEKAVNSDKETWPKIPERKIIPPQAQATIEVLKLLLKVECVQHHVAPKLVADSEDLERIAMEDNPDVPALKGWRYDVFGKDALELKAGKIAIGLKNNKITKHKVEQ